MKIRYWMAIAIAVVEPVFAAEPLRVLNWEEYLSPVVIDLWESETGIKIEQIYFDNDDDRDRMLSNYKDHSIDLAMIDETSSELFGSAGKLIAVSEKEAPMVNHIESFWRDRCSRFATPYMWGTLGLAYRVDKISTPPSSWSEILQPSDRLKGHISMMDDHVDLLAPSLLVQGLSINSSDPQALKSAFDELSQQAPSVLTYEYPITYLGHGEHPEELYMGMVYSGDQYVLNEISGTTLWRYVVPKEGTVLWVDCLAVMEGSHNREAAIEFINFLNRPDIAAINSEAIYIATPNGAALELLSDEFKNDPVVFGGLKDRSKMQFYTPLEVEMILLRKRIVSSVKLIHDTK